MSAVRERWGGASEPRPVPRSVYPICESSVVGTAEFPVQRVAAAFRGVLQSIGLDLDDPNLAMTPDRVARAYREILGGLRSPEPTLSTFPNTRGHKGVVAVTDIPFYSVCSHHFLPFFGSAHMGYLPANRLIGLSKVSRAVDFYARRPQLQEDLTEQIASLLQERLEPKGLIVALEARHLCMEMRGVSRPGVLTKTMAVRGALEDPLLQQQFFARVGGSAAGRTGTET
ncbi:MAG TPA: GTP cyclohydrolase I [Thermoanaerobaculia bacterium]|nr:GTP cyclohydrolase I [Thermoanaerobaculia bacterium]